MSNYSVTLRMFHRTARCLNMTVVLTSVFVSVMASNCYFARCCPQFRSHSHKFTYSSLENFNEGPFQEIEWSPNTEIWLQQYTAFFLHLHISLYDTNCSLSTSQYIWLGVLRTITFDSHGYKNNNRYPRLENSLRIWHVLFVKTIWIKLFQICPFVLLKKM